MVSLPIIPAASLTKVLMVAVVAAMIPCGVLLIQREAHAGAGMGGAAAAAGGSIDGCANYTNKAVYDCVAGVLDKLAGQLGGDTGQTAGALRSAASQLRAATTKAQALSAISACRSAIAGALRQVRAIGGAAVAGWGGGPGKGSGLEAIVSVLGRAMALVQSKG